MKRIVSILTCGVLAFGCLAPTAAAEETDKDSDGDRIEISSITEMVELSKNCISDAWSLGKTFVLTNDIDLSHSGFEEIPYFAGTFDGGWHTVSGLRVSSDGSVKGLFRYTGSTARIKDLNVTGRVYPGGTQNSIGGIVGENSGEIVRCTFEGDVRGIKCVGGIAGVNTETGVISECSSSGEVDGEHSVGGIAGEDRGILTDCTNSADVNNKEITVKSDKTIGINLITDITQIKRDVSEVSEENLLNISDIGGIAGHLTGVAEGCVNKGTVGYEHMGYNVGGIAGRSSGRISGCENSGEVYARKDAGGIAGQIEPFACWDFSDSKVSELQDQLDDLQSKIDTMIDNGEGRTADARAKLTEMDSELKAASEELRRLREQTSGDIDASQRKLEEMRGIVNDYLNSVSDSAEKLDKYAGEAKDAIGSIASDTAENVKGQLDEKQKKASDIAARADSIIQGAVDDSGLAEYSALLSDLSEKIKNDPNNEKAAELMELLKSVADDETQMHLTVREQVRLIREEIETGDIEGLIASLEELKNSRRDIIDDERIDRMLELMKELELPSADISAFESYISDMQTRTMQLQSDIDSLISVLSETKELLDVDVPEVNTTKLTKVMDEMYDSIDLANEKDFIERMRSAASGLELNVPDLNEFFAHLKRAGELAAELSDAALTDSGISGEINDVRDSFNNVLDVFSGTVEDVSTVKTDYEQDVSDGSERSSNGTVKDCLNSGSVTAENNAGGIVGTMAFELELDKEDTLNLSQYMMSDARYLIYTVIDGCTGRGDVYSKKDCAGGIVGNMDFGTVTNSISMGMVSVPNGDYCGGIAGRSYGKIRGCYTRTVLEGGRYVGGIAGYANIIDKCLSYSFIDSKAEFMGSAAGFAEGSVTDCRFVNNGLGGIDGVSKSGESEAIEYADLIKLENVPEEFKKIVLTFIADDKVVGKVEVPFGGKIDPADIPEVPRDGDNFWKWDDAVNSEVYYSMAVHGEYVPPITTLATEGDRPLVLAEGLFCEGQELTAEPVSESSGGDVSYRVSVSGNTAPLLVRFRSDIEDGLLLINGVKQKYERDGSYIVFKLDNGQTFTYSPVEKDYSRYYLIGGICGGALVILITVIAIISHRKRKAKSKS